MYKGRTALIAALLCASTFGIAYAKTYDVTWRQPIASGNVELPPGTYRLEYKDSTATLTNTTNGKDYKIPVKVTATEKKFKDTRVDSDSSVKPEQLRSIELGGSNVRLDFGK